MPTRLGFGSKLQLEGLARHSPHSELHLCPFDNSMWSLGPKGGQAGPPRGFAHARAPFVLALREDPKIWARDLLAPLGSGAVTRLGPAQKTAHAQAGQPRE